MATTWINRGHLYCPHVTPVIVDCRFTVNSTDSAGLGITSGSLKGQGVTAVYMHTSATPAATNPNPQSGTILVQLSDNFTQLYSFHADFASPMSGTPILVASAGVTSGLVYTITVVGTTTQAGWVTLGLPPGITPAVGVSFVAKATTTAAGTGAVQVPLSTASGIDHIENVGYAHLILGPTPVGGSPNVGGWAVLNCEKNTALTAPSNGTIIRLTWYLSQSSVQVAGE